MTRFRPGTAATLALVLAAGLAGCGGFTRSGGSAGDTGITATSVLVGSTQPLTGPGAPGQLEVAPATRAYFDWVDAHGGVHGRRIDYTVLDDADDPAAALAAAHRLVQHNHVAAVLGAAGVAGLAAHQSSATYLAEAGVPDLFPAGGFEPAPDAEGLLLARWVAAQPGATRVGVLFRNDDYGQQGLAGVRAALPAGAVVSAQGYAGSDLNLDGPVARLRADGAGTVIAFTTPTATAMAELSARRQGWDPRWVVASAGADPVAVRQALTALAGGHGGLTTGPAAGTEVDLSPVDGVVSDAYLPAASDPQDSWVAVFRQIWAASPSLRAVAPVFDGEVVLGMTQAELFTAALAAAGSNPGRADLVAAVRRGLPPGPGLLPLIPPGSTGGGGYSGAEVVRWSGVSWRPLGPPEVVQGTSVRSVTLHAAPVPADGIPGS